MSNFCQLSCGDRAATKIHAEPLCGATHWAAMPALEVDWHNVELLERASELQLLLLAAQAHHATMLLDRASAALVPRSRAVTTRAKSEEPTARAVTTRPRPKSTRRRGAASRSQQLLQQQTADTEEETIVSAHLPIKAPVPTFSVIGRNGKGEPRVYAPSSGHFGSPRNTATDAWSANSSTAIVGTGGGSGGGGGGYSPAALYFSTSNSCWEDAVSPSNTYEYAAGLGRRLELAAAAAARAAAEAAAAAAAAARAAWLAEEQRALESRRTSSTQRLRSVHDVHSTGFFLTSSQPAEPPPPPKEYRIVFRDIACRDVPTADAKGGSDPYVRFTLLECDEAQGKPVGRTQPLMNTSNPRWEHAVQLRVPPGSPAALSMSPLVQISVRDERARPRACTPYMPIAARVVHPLTCVACPCTHGVHAYV